MMVPPKRMRLLNYSLIQEKNIDFPSSDKMWVEYFEAYRHLRFATPPDPTLCALVENYKSVFNESVVCLRTTGLAYTSQ